MLAYPAVSGGVTSKDSRVVMGSSGSYELSFEKPHGHCVSLLFVLRF